MVLEPSRFSIRSLSILNFFISNPRLRHLPFLEPHLPCAKPILNSPPFSASESQLFLFSGLFSTETLSPPNLPVSSFLIPEIPITFPYEFQPPKFQNLSQLKSRPFEFQNPSLRRPRYSQIQNPKNLTSLVSFSRDKKKTEVSWIHDSLKLPWWLQISGGEAPPSFFLGDRNMFSLPRLRSSSQLPRWQLPHRCCIRHLVFGSVNVL